MNPQSPTQTMSLAQGKKLMAVTGVLALAALFVAVPDMAHASSTSATAEGFEDVWETLKDWTNGSLGRVIAGAMILVGIIGGIARQSIMAFALGIAGGMGLTYAPNVIESIVGATLASIPSATSVTTTLANGLGLGL